ncbi:MAG: methyltransferase domain-containing protein [bacterium]
MMLTEAMAPFGLALRDYADGDESAEMEIERDDGLREPLPIGFFFRTPSEFFPLERSALELCRGRVLDIGAGSGIHSLELQKRGFNVKAIDVSPDAVSVMSNRGVSDARCADVFTFSGERFDTLLLLGHGIGMTETLDGLDRFLDRMHMLLQPGGQILLHSLDVTKTDVTHHLAYHRKNIDAGRYAGEIRMRIRYRDVIGPTYSWIQVDPDTLADHASKFNWRTEVVVQEPDGNYLARLTLESF